LQSQEHGRNPARTPRVTRGTVIRTVREAVFRTIRRAIFRTIRGAIFQTVRDAIFRTVRGAVFRAVPGARLGAVPWVILGAVPWTCFWRHPPLGISCRVSALTAPRPVRAFDKPGPNATISAMETDNLAFLDVLYGLAGDEIRTIEGGEKS